MSLTKEDLAQVGQIVAQQVASLRDDMAAQAVSIRGDVAAQRSDMAAQAVSLRGDMAAQRSDMAALTDRLGKLDGELQGVSRVVNAIETAPAPYGRPKSYVSATEFHSVSNPVRVRQGRQG